MMRLSRFLCALVLLYRHSCAFVPNSNNGRSPNALKMFTGIVEEIGIVKAVEERDDIVMWDGSTGTATLLTVEGSGIMEGVYPG